VHRMLLSRTLHGQAAQILQVPRQGEVFCSNPCHAL
jgi:hypothetical protein